MALKLCEAVGECLLNCAGILGKSHAANHALCHGAVRQGAVREGDMTEFLCGSPFQDSPVFGVIALCYGSFGCLIIHLVWVGGTQIDKVCRVDNLLVFIDAGTGLLVRINVKIHVLGVLVLLCCKFFGQQGDGLKSAAAQSDE